MNAVENTAQSHWGHESRLFTFSEFRSIGYKISGNLTFPEIFRKFPEILAKAWKL